MAAGRRANGGGISSIQCSGIYNFFELFHLICFQTMTSYKKEVPIKFT